MAMKMIHLWIGRKSACGREGFPSDWGPDQDASIAVQEVNCLDCLAGNLGDSWYGHVDGPRPVPGTSEMAQALDTDPFESLLGMCRMLSFRYDVRERNGLWSAMVEPIGHWPTDYHSPASCTEPGANLQKTHHATYCCVGSANKLCALRTAMHMAISSLWHECEKWRSGYQLLRMALDARDKVASNEV